MDHSAAAVPARDEKGRSRPLRGVGPGDQAASPRTPNDVCLVKNQNETMRPIQTIACALSLFLCGCSAGSAFREVEIGEPYGRKVDSVLSLMTLEEKIGQLNQYTGNGQATGPVIDDTTKIVQIEKGLVGSMLNIRGAERTRRLQEYAMKSRLRIPLLFGLDVIHGMQTVFPVPLAEASSFDLDLMRRTAAGAAREAAAQGVHWTFAPMVDISRDARWGRVVEGAGEDPWYGSLVARARVEGFQGRSLADVTTVMACAKHFAAYGACIAGKDYNTTDLSLLTLHDTYLPPFRAAVESGVGSVMNGFNDLNGIPATGNAYLQRTLLKGEWGFDGLTVSDWGSIGEMVPHGYAADLRDAARAAITAGCDVDMESRAYVSRLRGLVADGEVAEACIDDAVRRILLKKFQLGLFDDPFRYCDPEREARTVLCDSLRSLAREAAVRSIVLLKNDGETLPLDRFTGTIALIGALADSRIDMRGIWASDGAVEEVVTVREGLEARYGRAKVLYAEGYDLETNRLHLAPALAAARRADVVVVAVGERYFQSGEARSKADIAIPRQHEELVRALKGCGKQVITLLMGGRPMIFDGAAVHSDVVLLTWWLGTEAGNAIADVLSGEYNPSGKLPMTFPAHVGQIPIYYNYKSTGRPESKAGGYTCSYQDIDFEPAYPFGFGLSYTTFEIGTPTLEKRVWRLDEPVTVRVTVKNTGHRTGRETVQLYIRDHVGSVTRPVRELRGFRQVLLRPGEQTEVVFTLGAAELGFWNADLRYVVEPGVFSVMCGPDSKNVKTAEFELR